MTALYQALVRDAIALAEGRAVAPCADPALHEAGHVVVGHALGLTVVHVSLRPTPCQPMGAHTCVHTDDPVRWAAVRWAGAIAERTLAWSTDDFEALGARRQHLLGRAFTVAEAIVAGNGATITRIAAALREPGNEGVLYAEEIAALMERPG